MSELTDRLKSFEKAFASNLSGCLRQCECGRIFYDAYGSYDWGDGEKEELQKNPKATPKDYTIGTIIFEGHEYAVDCNCWHGRAAQIIAWLENHGHPVANYLTLEKRRKTRLAENSPEVL